MSTTVIRPYRLYRALPRERYFRTSAPRIPIIITIFDQFKKPFPQGVPVKETGNIWLNYENIYESSVLGDEVTGKDGQVTDTFGCQVKVKTKLAYLYITQSLIVGDWSAIVATALIYDPNSPWDFEGGGTLSNAWLLRGTEEAFFH